MPQSLSSVLVHLIFSTKNRWPFIKSKIEKELHPYMASIFRALKSPSLTIGGYDDHVHILFSLARTINIAELVEEVKTDSSKWIKTKGEQLKNFYWQDGYGAFSVNPNDVDIVKAYIENQKEHHSKKTFQDEYRELLKQFNITYDERYVWD